MKSLRSCLARPGTLSSPSTASRCQGFGRRCQWSTWSTCRSSWRWTPCGWRGCHVSNWAISKILNGIFPQRPLDVSLGVSAQTKVRCFQCGFRAGSKMFRRFQCGFWDGRFRVRGFRCVGSGMGSDVGFGIGVCWFWRFWCRFRRSLGGCSVVVPEVSAWDRCSLAAATLSFFCCWGYRLGIFGFVDQFWQIGKDGKGMIFPLSFWGFWSGIYPKSSICGQDSRNMGKTRGKPMMDVDEP